MSRSNIKKNKSKRERRKERKRKRKRKRKFKKEKSSRKRMNIGFAQKKRKMKSGVWGGLRRRTRINVVIVNLLFYFMTVCCGESFLFKWDEVVVFGQPNYTSNGLNAGLGLPYSLAVDPLDGSLWVGTLPLQTNSITLFTFSANFSANFSSFVLQPSKSILIPNNPNVVSLLWLDSQTCLMGSVNNNANSSDLFVTRDHFTTTQQLPLDYNAFNDLISGLGYSDVSNQVFVLKSAKNQIRVLDNDGFFNKTLYVIGNAFNNNTLVSPPNASSLNYPWKIHQDCAGGFWVVDYGNCRVLHFAWNQTVADAVIGQPNFTTDCSSNLIFSQSNPNGIAMNSDCSIMWISDDYRILRFRAPFNNTSQPEGVLGQPDFSSDSSYPATASTFYGIYDILYDSKTKRLYLVDYFNNRVVTGVTDEGSLRLAIIYNNVTINSAETLEINSSGTDQTLAIGGSLDLKNGSLTRLNEGQVVLVARNITFGGMLTLVVNPSTQDQTVINVFNYSSSLNSSRFDQIMVTQTDGGRSGCFSGTGQYEEKNLAVLVGISSKCLRSSSTGEADGGSQTRTITLGVVVGVVGFCLLTCFGLAIILVVVVVVSKKRRTNREVAAKF